MDSLSPVLGEAPFPSAMSLIFTVIVGVWSAAVAGGGCGWSGRSVRKGNAPRVVLKRRRKARRLTDGVEETGVWPDATTRGEEAQG